MRKILLFALVASMGFFGQNVNAQNTSTEEKETEAQKEYRLEKEQEKKERIAYLKQKRADAIQYEKDQLKGRVSYINKRLEKGKITPEDAEAKKKAIAEYIAKNIENKTTIIDAQIALVERNGVMDNGTQVHLGLGHEDENGKRVFGISINDGKVKRKVVNHNRRTRSDFVFAVGFNNVIIEGQGLDDSPYRVAGSRFAELGWAWTTRVFKNDPWLRIKYGFSFQFNGLKPTGNRYFVEENGQTVLQEFDEDLDKSKFRIDNLVIPIHFEFGPYKKHEKDGSNWYSTHNKLKIGLGGYAGLNIGTLQKLKFSRDGNNVKEKERGDFDVNDFVYGLSGYVGWDNVGVYVKYDLNTIFTNSPVDQRNVSLGLRFDLD